MNLRLRIFISALSIATFVYQRALATAEYGHSGLFASAKEIFKPFLADPREIQMSGRYTTPVARNASGDIALGNYFGLYRWDLPWENAYLQWSMGGGVFARFDLVSEQKDNQLIDYLASMPLDLRVGKWSMRWMPFHISSHLGDDYIKRTGILPEKRALDGVKWFFAYEPDKSLRLYAGFHGIVRHTQAGKDRFALQSGVEWQSKWWAKGHAQTFFASDFQTWERVGWNPETNTQIGVRFAHDPQDKHAFAIFGEYADGHLAYGQFVHLRESHLAAGFRLEIP